MLGCYFTPFIHHLHQKEAKNYKGNGYFPLYGMGFLILMNQGIPWVGYLDQILSFSVVQSDMMLNRDPTISPSIKHFKPGFVYHRRQPQSSQILPHPITISDSVDLLRTNCNSYPPDRYGFSTILAYTTVPTSYSQETRHVCWEESMQEELQALQENHPKDIVPCPTGVKPIGYKWINSIKLRSDCSLDSYKERFVALDNRQEYEVDYEKTFAPVA